MLSQLVGVDAILVGDDMPDLTADAVVQQVRMNPAFEATPTYLLTSNEELSDAFGDRINGLGADGIDALSDVFEAKTIAAPVPTLSPPRRGGPGRAIAARARTSPRWDLEEAIIGRGDHVAIPALGALSEVGGAGQVDKMLEVLGVATSVTLSASPPPTPSV